MPSDSVAASIASPNRDDKISAISDQLKKTDIKMLEVNKGMIFDMMVISHPTQHRQLQLHDSDKTGECTTKCHPFISVWFTS